MESPKYVLCCQDPPGEDANVGMQPAFVFSVLATPWAAMASMRLPAPSLSPLQPKGGWAATHGWKKAILDTGTSRRNHHVPPATTTAIPVGSHHPAGTHCCHHE